MLGIPYAFDVLSNIALAIFGLWGLFKLKFMTRLSYFKLAVALGIIWTAAGSTYFHLAPSFDRIFWDRLPMSVVFGTIIGWLITDEIHFKAGVCRSRPAFRNGSRHSASLAVWS
ncbi:MAG: hypothetical protein H7326_05785 [Bdellovibrionaceae bacterium]|nr:hypothetical protein [Pseudobdellovibrionaceae bacterium]